MGGAVQAEVRHIVREQGLLEVENIYARSLVHAANTPSADSGKKWYHLNPSEAQIVLKFIKGHWTQQIIG